MNFLLRLPFLLLAIPCIVSAAPAPANPEATPAARAVLSFLASLEARTERRLLSGQFTGFANQNSAGFPGEIHRKTGQWPAMVGVDYALFKPGSMATGKANATALAYWRAGGLVTVSAHLDNPANPHGAGLRDKGVDLAALLVPGTDTHRRWMRQLDEIAAGLEQLRRAGVVVLWRPFHEMNGGWFWWGAKDPAVFGRVWRHMFTYFSGEKHLDNLLWVYSPNHRHDADAFYPGDDCVDVVGFDVYTDFIDPEHIKGYTALAARPKPFGFTEYGPHGAKNPPGNYDYRRFVEGAAKHFPRAVFFLCWDDNWAPHRNREAKAFYNDPRLLNRDALPAGLAGRP